MARKSVQQYHFDILVFVVINRLKSKKKEIYFPLSMSFFDKNTYCKSKNCIK